MKKLFMLSAAAALIYFSTFCLASFAAEQTQKSAQIIETGKKVSLEYTLRLADGTLVESNVEKAPLVYVQGSSQIIPGLEKALLGLKVGDTKKVEVLPKEGYGEYNPKATQEIPKSTIQGTDLKLGAKLYSRDSYGRVNMAVVKEIKKDTVVIDINHPLAGKTLYFEVKVLKIE